MPVTLGAKPTEVNFDPSALTPPAGRVFGVFESGAAYPDPNSPQKLVRDLGLHVANVGKVNPQSGSAYTLQASDQGKLVVMSNASNPALTLDSTLVDGFMCGVLFTGAAGCGLTPSSGTLNGSASKHCVQGAGGLLFFNGTNWWLMPDLAVMVAAIQLQSYVYADDTGAANAYVVALTPAPAAYGEGMLVMMKVAHANTGASTINVSGLGNKNIKVFSGGSKVDPPAGTMAAGQIIPLVYDNTDFQIVGGGSSGGSSFTAGGDLSGSSSSQEVIGILSTLFDSPGTAWADGQIIQFSSTLGKLVRIVDRPDRVASAVAGKPSAGQIVAIYTAAYAVIFPANFTSPDSKGSVGTNPTATATYTVYKNGSSVGTIAISTSGVFTFTTSGFTLNAGDRLTIVAPGSQDTTLADVGITLVGTRGAAVSSSTVQPLFTWRGTYSGATAYSPFDVVAYTVSGKIQSYVCKLATTGNAPTNTTYWDLLAQAGADGTVASSQIQQQSLIYAADAGSANAYSVTLSPAPGVVDGSVVVFRAANASTGASTLTLPGDTGATGGTAKTLVKQGSVAIAAGDISANGIVIAVWDNAHTRWVMVGGGGGDTTAAYLIGAADATLTNAIVWPGITKSYDVPPASAGSIDDEFDGTFSGWTWLNQGTSSAQNANSLLCLKAQADSGNQIRGIYKTAPATPWQAVLKCDDHEMLSFTNFAEIGILLSDSSNKGIVLAISARNTANQFGLSVDNFNASSYGSAVVAATNVAGPPWYLSVKDDGTNLLFYAGKRGGQLTQIGSVSRTAFLTSGPTRVGIAVFSNGANQIVTGYFDFFRRTL